MAQTQIASSDQIFQVNDKNNRARRLAIVDGLMIVAFTIAILVFLITPFLALSWSLRPFLGFVVEQTLVVSNIEGMHPARQYVRLDHPDRITHIGYRAVKTPAEFDQAVASYGKGQWVQLRTELPDGSQRIILPLEIGEFPRRDLFRLFWLPYCIGLAYLVIGFWVYRMRGSANQGRAFAYFCISAAVTNALLFDLTTTHAGSGLWTVTIAQQGGALISLALLFPEEWPPVTQRPWLRFLPYIISLFLAGWGLLILNDTAKPWAYISAWRSSYLYTAAGIVIFLGMMLYRLLTNSSPLKRQQARIILLGGAFAFTPIAFWFSSSIFGLSLPWNPALFLPLLLIFPLSIAFAIQRYRLWDADVLINRTLVYGVLSIVLALLYWVGVIVFQQVFDQLTGQHSRLAVASSTLAIAALFHPLRRYIQGSIDRRFYRRKYNVAQTLAAFSATLRNEVDLDKLVERLETVIGETLQPAHTLSWLSQPEGFRLHFTFSDQFTNEHHNLLANLQVSWEDPFPVYLWGASEAISLEEINLDSTALKRMKAAGVKVVVPLISQGELTGWLSLGPRLSEQGYSADDRALLTNLAAQAAPAVMVAQLINQQRVESLQRERLETELRLAQLIQKALLPKELPALPGWQVAAYYQPASEVGGDFYDFIQFEDGRLGLFIGDVTDKGIPAALVMATTRSLLHAVARQLVNPGEVLEKVNNLLQPDIPPGMFVTCLYALLDPQNGRLQYANAGHNLPFRRLNGSTSVIQARGMPLGLMPDMYYEEKETVIAPGESLVFLSDGLVEAHNANGEMFGNPRLQEWIARHDVNGSGMIEYLLAELAEFTGPDWEQEDDVTLVTLEYLANESMAVEASYSRISGGQ